ncbi:MAG TPA: hypothetical protein VEH29_06820 [Acidimicrobiales bacterium]|nr:hypothetical protein [Acidimicrobiales bacterium]
MSQPAEHPVQVGRMLFTLVDPTPGHEVAYNRWYERDHFYAGCLVGPWLFAGRRWVATRPLKDLRFPLQSPFTDPVTAGSYLSIYWVLAGHEDEHFAWARRQVYWLYGQGRGFSERTHAHTKLYDFEGAVSRWRDGVPLELALDHPYEGLVVLCCEPGDGGSHDALAEASADHVAILLQAPGMDLVSNWRFHVEERDFEAPMALGSEGGTTERMVQLGFVQGRPEAVWPAVHRYAADLEASGAGRVTFAAPFIPTIVGTDTYTDELW